MASTLPTPRSRMRSTACGLWMTGPRVTTARPPEPATSITFSTVRRTPQQNPAVFAILTSMADLWRGRRPGATGAPPGDAAQPSGRARPLLAHEAVLLVAEEDVEGGQAAVALR